MILKKSLKRGVVGCNGSHTVPSLSAKWKARVFGYNDPTLYVNVKTFYFKLSECISKLQYGYYHTVLNNAKQHLRYNINLYVPWVKNSWQNVRKSYKRNLANICLTEVHWSQPQTINMMGIRVTALVFFIPHFGYLAI